MIGAYPLTVAFILLTILVVGAWALYWLWSESH